MHNIWKTLGPLALAVSAWGAQAAVVTLSFEGIVPVVDGTDPDTPVGSFYQASGISFEAAALASKRSAAGGSGSFPASSGDAAGGGSASMILVGAQPGGVRARMAVAGGFNGLLSFEYWSNSGGSFCVLGTGTDCLNGNRQTLAETPLVGDTNVRQWTTVSFDLGATTATAVDFGGNSYGIAFDNIRLDLKGAVVDPPGDGSVPEPSSLALAALALGGLGLRRRRLAG